MIAIRPLYAFPFATARTDRTGIAAARALPLAAADLIATGRIAAARYVHVPGAGGPAGPLPLPLDLAKLLGTGAAALEEGHALSGELHGTPDAPRLLWRLHAVPTLSPVADGEITPASGSLASAPGLLARAVADALRLAVPPDARAVLERPLTSSEKAMARFVEGASLASAAGRDGRVRLQGAALLKEALAIDPDFGRASEMLHALGLFLLKTGKLDDALDAFHAVVKARPRDARALAAVAETHIRANDLAKAVKPLTRAAELDPSDDNLLLKLGWLAEMTGEVALAKQCYLEARGRDLAPAKVLEKLATVHLASGEPEEALRYAREGVTLSPKDGLFPYIAALSLHNLGRRDEALATALAGEKAVPGYWGLPHLLATLHAERGDAAAADAAKARARALEPELDRSDDDVARFRDGHALIRDGRVEEGLAKLREVVANDDRFWEAWLYLGVGLRHIERRDEALPCFERVLALKPEQAEAHNEIAVHCLETGQHARALKHAAEACRIKPENPGFLCNHGLARLYMGETESAEKLFLAAKWADPENEVADNCLNLLHELRREGKAPGEPAAPARP